MLTQIKRYAGAAARKFGYRIERIKPQKSPLVFANVPGWFSQEEADLLYLIGFMAQGPILEIGHFLGRSTSVLCQSIQDSGRPIQFNSYDLGFGSAEEFVEAYRRIYDGRSIGIPKELEEMVFSRNASTTDIARRNLRELNLDGYVNLIAADFSQVDVTKYDLIFCDAMHDAHEIQVNIPAIIRCSQNICTWAFHDMSDENVQAVSQAAPVKFITRRDSLGVFQFHSSNL